MSSKRRKNAREWMQRFVAAAQPRKDALLASLVSMADIGASTGITIVVTGTAYSGDLVGAKVYAAETAKNLGEALERALGAAAPKETFQALIANTASLSDGFLHLAKLRRHTEGGTIVNVAGAMMRVRLASIDAWWVGVPT